MDIFNDVKSSYKYTAQLFLKQLNCMVRYRVVNFVHTAPGFLTLLISGLHIFSRSSLYSLNIIYVYLLQV
jgi:hypothetical protein